MRRAYLLVASAICVLGLYVIADDLIRNSGMGLFRGIGALVGLAVVFSAIFHLLNYQYASVARAVSGVAFGASVALLAGILWASWGQWEWTALLLAGLLAVASVCSLAPAVRRPKEFARAGAV
jgi:hypothetical protein